VMDTAFDADFGEAWRREQCLGILGMPGVWLSLGFSGDQVRGFTLSRIVADEAELLLIAVMPAGQRQGLGAMLLENAINNAAGRGASRLHLEVREGNPASSLYRRFGFVPVGRRHAYYRGKFGQSFDALTLTCVL
jgi:[ribosomal protein S18]-alanine N-acetyltransferase